VAEPAAQVAGLRSCARCGATLDPRLLACPACATLVHADELKRLAADAERAAAAGELTEALTLWRRVLGLLPADSRQYAVVQERVRGLSAQVDGGAAPAPSTTGPAPAARARGPLAGAAAFLLLVFSKIKFLLLGLSKATTFFSMFATFAIYWQIWGWKWALGFVATTYVHEMGHVAALRRFGIPATAPMFIPGFGALVRLKQYPASVAEDARIGLAGPIWGAAAAIGCAGVYLLTGWNSFAATAVTAAFLNLFNLLPIWTLDGSRGFRALSRSFRWIAAGSAIAAAWYLDYGMLYLVGAVGVYRAFGKDAPAEGDRTALATYVGIVLVLAALLAWLLPLVSHSSLPVRMMPQPS